MIVPDSFSTARREHGFTLLELLLAIALLAMVTGAAFFGFSSMLVTKNSVEKASDNLAALQSAFLIIGRDLQQITPRAIQDAYGHRQHALVLDNSAFSGLEFTRNGWHNQTERTRSNLQRVAYLLEGDKLLRRHWFNLDRTGAESFFERVILSGVKEVSWQFLDRKDRWRRSWPPELRAAKDQEVSFTELPRAISINLDLEEWGEIKRIFVTVGEG